MSEKPSQIVYVLTNPVMPGIIKIGMTTQPEVSSRMKLLELISSIPTRCVCLKAQAGKADKAVNSGAIHNASNAVQRAL